MNPSLIEFLAMQYLLYPIALYFLILAIRHFVTFLHLRKLTLQYAQFKLQSAATTPDHLKTLFQKPMAALAQDGFKPCCFMQTRTVTKVEPGVACDLLLYNPSYKTYAVISIRLLAESADPFDIDFYTFFNDRTLLVTTNGRAYDFLGEMPQAIIQDPYSADLAVQWQMHQDQLNQLADDKSPRALVPHLFVKALQLNLKAYIDRLVQTGTLVPTSQPGEFQLSWRAALRQTVKTVKYSGKIARLTQQRRQQVEADPIRQVEIPVEIEVLSYQRMEFLHRGLVGRKLRTWLLLGSLALFLAVYTQLFSPEKLVLLLGALLLHEGGHLLAMKLFGYRDTVLLFLPFLGALASARKEDATLSQKFWIALAGPLPGLILGVGLLIFANSSSPATPRMVEASWILIGLNLFNLLPLYPLDGGQIADLLVFSRHPYVGVAFKSMGVMVLGLLSLAQPLMLVFAALIAFSIPGSFQTAKVTAKLHQDLQQVQSNDRATVLPLIFQQLKQFGHGHLPFAQRYGLAKNLLLTRHELQAKWTTRVALSLLYCLSLFGGIAGTLQAAAPNWTSVIADARRPTEQRQEQHQEQQTRDKQHQVDEATIALQTNPNDIETYLKRAQARAGLQDYQGALADYDEILRLKPNHVSTLFTRAMYRSISGDTQGALQDYTLILRLEPHNLEAYQQRARVQMSLKDYQAAITDTTLMLRLQPNRPDAYVLRSAARRSLGDMQGAIADQQKADAFYRVWQEGRDRFQ